MSINAKTVKGSRAPSYPPIPRVAHPAVIRRLPMRFNALATVFRAGAALAMQNASNQFQAAFNYAWSCGFNSTSIPLSIDSREETASP
ncbi:hypothetical protein LJ656_18405 [Paraburkholderia sp. MMS20-SJTR3]|uniref:Uncharacterized protein n=1 Tax=Paraburkholderia sejongensis TaxID=2886946 RepID=A0ABS8JXD2_9BURK|nr:hypothetical protein [Paraburkholderia sp. MMS20-SJTR3]MCC8394566.1 hypothetical protein [Paraburkholderia sp. MMS20-SJTR3]